MSTVSRTKRFRSILRTLLLPALLAIAGSVTARAIPNAVLHVTPERTDSACCWDLTFTQQFGSTGNITRVTAYIMTPGVTVVSASNASWSMPSPVYAANGTSISWRMPTAAGLDPTETGHACFNNNSGQPSFTVIFTGYDAQGNTAKLLNDTITLDCASNPDPCLTQSLRLNTGWDHAANAVSPIGAQSAFWNVVGDPLPSTIEPRPAFTVQPISDWANAPANSQWICAQPNIFEASAGIFTYQACFCLAPGAINPRLVLDVLADDRAEVFVNGCSVGVTVPAWAFHNPPLHIDNDISSCVVPGQNCITIKVTNDGGPMGLAVSGNVSTDDLGVLKPACCGLGGTISGAKFWDQNCNGRRDAGEPGLANWTIRMNNGSTTTTDAQGNYAFTNVLPGTYLVTEVQQSGWTQSTPAGGGYTVTVTPLHVTANVDFGNCKGCFTVVEPVLYCAPGGYQLCFRINNQSGFAAQYFDMLSISPGGIAVSPASLSLGAGLSPGATSAPYCVMLTGPGANPGVNVTINVRFCDKLRQNCCSGSFSVKLPVCPPVPDCCANFVKNFTNVVRSASSNGLANFSGLVSAGPSPITKVSATIINSTINGAPAYGYFIPTNSMGPLGAGAIVPPPYSHEVTWGPSGPVNLYLPAASFGLRMRFPPMAWYATSDLLRYDIRFRFTDRECRTCDIVVHVEQPRYAIIYHGYDWEHLDRGTDDPKRGGYGIQTAGGGATLSGGLVGSDSGTMRVVFPTLPSQLGAGAFTGLTIAPDSIALTGATCSDTRCTFSVAGGAATATFEAKPGDELTVGLKYAGLAGRGSLLHRVVLRYVLASAPGDTLEEETTVTLRRAGLSGGDALGEEKSDMSDVRTFALHLSNMNGSHEPIDRLVITTAGRARIIAVGPTANDSVVMLGIGSMVSGFNADSVALAPGGSRKPIYITIAGTAGNTAPVHFATLDAEGQMISEGDITLTSPLLSVKRDERGGTAVAGVMLEQSYPNPASHSATIAFRLPASASGVTLVVTDAAGREITRLIDGESLAQGEHVVSFATVALPSGTYYYTLRVGTATETRSMRVIK